MTLTASASSPSGARSRSWSPKLGKVRLGRIGPLRWLALTGQSANALRVKTANFPPKDGICSTFCGLRVKHINALTVTTPGGGGDMTPKTLKSLDVERSSSRLLRKIAYRRKIACGP